MHPIKRRFFLCCLIGTVCLITGCSSTSDPTHIPNSLSAPTSDRAADDVAFEAEVPVAEQFVWQDGSAQDLCTPNLKPAALKEDEFYRGDILTVSGEYALYALYKVSPSLPDEEYTKLIGVYAYTIQDGAISTTIQIPESWGVDQAFIDNENIHLLITKEANTNELSYQWLIQPLGSETALTIRQGIADWHTYPQLNVWSDSLALFEYEKENRRIVGYSQDGKPLLSLPLGDKEPLSLKISCSDSYFLLLVMEGKTPRFEIYNNSMELVLCRDLASNERVYTWQMLSGGAFLYLQDISQSSQSYKIVWLSLTEDTIVEYTEKAQLFGVVSNQTNTLAFLEYFADSANRTIAHIYTTNAKEITQKEYLLPQELSTLPSRLFIDQNTVYLYVGEQNRLFYIASI